MAPEPDPQTDREQTGRDHRDRDDDAPRGDAPVTGEAELVPDPDVALEADDSFTA